MIPRSFSDEEQVTFYPTYGYLEGTVWRIPMRIWVHEPRSFIESAITKLVAGIGNLNPNETNNFRSRIADFVADDEASEKVIIKFDHDSDDEEYRVQDKDGAFHETDLNGLIEGFITLSENKTEKLLRSQGSQNGWLTFHAASMGHFGVGRVRLIPPSGRSVISDIDDTIKITDIPAGVEEVLRNTFFRDFRKAPGMDTRYQNLGEAAFHYVSAGPWQMYRPLAEFLFSAQGGFPEGTFHMRYFPKNVIEKETWQILHRIVELKEEDKFDHKVEQISVLMRAFPHRRFLLFGDNGEKDPEVYRQIWHDFPHQVEEILIRYVVDDNLTHPDRLQGMTIIPAD
jgi:Phosphatidate phosphatase APP1, catalytic domain